MSGRDITWLPLKVHSTQKLSVFRFWAGLLCSVSLIHTLPGCNVRPNCVRSCLHTARLKTESKRENRDWWRASITYKRLKNDIVRVAVWPWPVGDRWQRLLEKICKRTKGLKCVITTGDSWEIKRRPTDKRQDKDVNYGTGWTGSDEIWKWEETVDEYTDRPFSWLRRLPPWRIPTHLKHAWWNGGGNRQWCGSEIPIKSLFTSYGRHSSVFPLQHPTVLPSTQKPLCIEETPSFSEVKPCIC